LFTGATGRHHLIESLIGGCALLDLDGDGHPDAFFVNGTRLPGDHGAPGPTFRFFVNQGAGNFVERTRGSGLDIRAYGMGVCAGDYDGDGRIDLYVTALGKNHLFRNLGSGHFKDVTDAAGVGDGGFSTGATFFDADGDGYLDLYVSHYVRYDPSHEPTCGPHPGLVTYCGPQMFAAEPDHFFHNNGDGTFTDATQRAGFAEATGKGLGVIAGDFDSDGDLDLYVANDKTPKFLWVNDGRGHFREEGLLRGAAVSLTGEEQAGMGVDAADVDGSGRLDLLVTNYSQEYNTLYHNTGAASYQDVTRARGLAEPTLLSLAFGVRFLDVDLDGAMDIMYANGHVMDNVERLYPGVTYAEPVQLFHNDGTGHFTDISAASGEPFHRPIVARGLAAADVDGDGLEEILIARTDGPALLLRNPGPPRGHWLRVRLQGRTPNVQAIGARVTVVSDERRWFQEVRSGSSYLSQSELALTFGIGPRVRVDRVEVRWPAGKTETFRVSGVDRQVTLVRGQGRETR
jgi:hypothetical protein